MSAPPTRVALVLGAGGPVGHAYHAGVLAGLHAATGWEPRSADLMIGTSAGAQVAALLRAGMSADDLYARTGGGAMTAPGRLIARSYVRPESRLRLGELLSNLTPPAPDYLRRVATGDGPLRLGALLASLLPSGRLSLEPQAEGFRQLFGGRWPKAPLWMPAFCIDRGERAVFGKPGQAPEADPGSALTASNAVPLLNEPVVIDGHRYIDGAFASLTHLDLVDEVDLALVSSPLTFEVRHSLGALRHPIRSAFRRQLANEQKAVRRRGISVEVIHPTAPLVGLMGLTVMNTARMATVAREALSATFRLLERPEERERLEPLYS